MSTDDINDKNPAPYINEEELNDPYRIITIRSTIQDVWKSDFKEPLHKLVDTTNRLVTHTYSFVKYIFLKEMDITNDQFDMNTYVKKGFFVEVFLSLIERQVRDRTKTGKTRLSVNIAAFKTIINKHKDTYFQSAKYTPPKITNAQQIALYECEKIHTAYFNNLKSQFGNRLRMYPNCACKLKEKISDICTRMKSERYSEEDIRDMIKRNVTQPCNNIKDQVSKKEVPKATSMLNLESVNEIKSFISMYPAEYNFQKGNYYARSEMTLQKSH
ncbi:hypothetical protein G6F56_006761 [Rhizopus delemar]|nr:hypothetical protein G6F56_006761 [Rhizopus delemar]